ncbi:MAG: alpha/beta fold hydrolase [Gammaproteobacteria bacterium]
MTALPLRGYAGAPGAQLHYRMLGDGPPVFLLHASPLSSAFMMGQLQALAAAGHRAVALDTPGYGQSDPLPATPQSLTDYAHAFLAGIDAMGGIDTRRFALYGAATGAQLALALARLAPQRVTRLVVDNCALFTDAQVADWEPRYFPDLTPRADGSHMTKVWEVARRQFVSFPWFSEVPEHQLDRPPAPLAVVQSMANHFLLATPGYDAAYRLAFHAENARSFQGLVVPTVLIDWEGSIVHREVQALVAEGLPSCVRVVRAAASVEARMSALVEAVAGA